MRITLWNLYPCMTFPIFSAPPTNCCTYPSRDSSALQVGFTTFPLLFPTPHSLRQNSVSILNSPVVCWTNGFHFFPFLSLYVFIFRFHSYCATVPQHCSNILIMFHFSFSLSHWIASLLSHYLSIG